MPASPPQLRAALDSGHALLRDGRFPEVIRIAQDVLRSAPRDAETHWMLSAAMLALGDAGGARAAAERGIKVAPGNGYLHFALARSLIRFGPFREADRAINRALDLVPGEPHFLATKADLLLTHGRAREARDLLEPVIEAHIGVSTLVCAYALACRLLGDAGRSAEVLVRCLAEPEHGRIAMADLYYDLGEALDAAGDFDRAFDAFAKANERRREPYDPAVQSRSIDALIRAWSPEVARSLPRGPGIERPVFIVGFWRSGTTLVEQTLSMHPDVGAGGEMVHLVEWVRALRDPAVRSAEPLLTTLAVLTRPAVERLAREYLAALKAVSPTAKRVTDKLPTNFLHLGLISRLFPGARVIHCVRDPLDTCLSCYFNMRGPLGYTHDLAWLGSFYRDYRRLMAHWESALDLPILDVAYEDFVADQETQARRIVEFLKLPWNDACLRPHESRRIAATRSIDQVRKPVYKASIARWKRYERHLGPLLKALGD